MDERIEPTHTIEVVRIANSTYTVIINHNEVSSGADTATLEELESGVAYAALFCSGYKSTPAIEYTQRITDEARKLAVGERVLAVLPFYGTIIPLGLKGVAVKGSAK